MLKRRNLSFFLVWMLRSDLPLPLRSSSTRALCAPLLLEGIR